MTNKKKPSQAYLKVLGKRFGLVEGLIDHFELSPDELYLESSSPSGKGNRNSFSLAKVTEGCFLCHSFNFFNIVSGSDAPRVHG
jgi:hypothetical protein